MQLPHGLVHILMRLLQLIRFLLLLRSQERTDLGHGIVHDRFGFLHRVLMDGNDLRFGLVQDRLDLRLLVRGQAQCLAHVFERVPMTAVEALPSFTSAISLVLTLTDGETSERDGAGGR